MSVVLEEVDQLTIQILVDNSIEWFTKLPEGFTHEVPQHLHNNPIHDERTHSNIIDLDNYCCGKYDPCAHGLSILLTTKKAGVPYSLLFDAGPDTRAFERNYASLHLGDTHISRVVLSHWHRDHSGGLTSIVNLQPGIIVDLHPDRPIARGSEFVRGSVARLPEDPTFEELEKLGGQIEKNKEEHVVGAGSVYISGKIPRVISFEGPTPYFQRWYEDSGEKGKGEWRYEGHLMDERYVAVDVRGKGLVIFSACSHAGIANVLTHATQRFGKPIHMVLGGFHLIGDGVVERIDATVNYIANELQPRPRYVLPMHCTGFSGKIALANALGEGCVPCGVGHRIEIVGGE